MSAGTKVTIAIVVLFAVLLGVYYGFGGSSGPAGEAPQPEVAGGDIGLPADPLGDPGTLEAEAAPELPGVLASEVEQVVNADTLAFDGSRPAVTKTTEAPRDDLWMIGPPPAFPPPEPAVRKTAVGTEYVNYVVQEGDSMWTIAQEWLGRPDHWGRIADANPSIKPDRLRIGQRLRIPVKASAPKPRLNRPASVARKTADPLPSGAVYTVQSGDTLSKISKFYYRDEEKWHRIYEANRTAIGWDPDRLKVGMRLSIP